MSKVIMRSTMGWLLPFVCSLGICMLPTAFGVDDCPDEYLYTQQPPAASVCNPYALGILKLDCAVVGDDVLDIRWYFSETSTQENPVLLSNSTSHTLSPHQEDNTYGVQLTVHLDGDTNVGFYWCQAFVPSGSLTTSSTFQLQQSDEYQHQDFECRFVLRRSETQCASLIRLPETTQSTVAPPTTSHPTTTLPIPSQSPTITTSSTTSIMTSTNSEPTLPPSPGSFFGTSEFILYVVLGLVGCLAVICLCLAVMIIVLCRRRCQGLKNNEAENNAIGFDHLSNQSDFALISYHKRPSPPISPYQPETSLSSAGDNRIIQNRDLSGDYAEIGPALIMNSDRLHHLHSYSEIRDGAPPLPEPNPGMMVIHSSLTREVDPCSTSSYENPYDLPILPPSDDSEQEGRPGSEEVDFGSVLSGNYHVLERSISNENAIPGQISSSSSFSTPPTSPPHSYQTLEDSVNAVSHVPCGQYDHMSQGQFSPQMYESGVTPRLETIPEHPYHVLDGSCNQDSPELEQDAATVTENPKDCVAAEGCTSMDDRDYDRLVDPPHLYHVLEHSPSLNKPRIHEFHFSDYNHLEGPAPSKTDHTHPQVRLHNPLPADLSMLTESLSSESSLNDSEVFDDPQYALSPVSKRKLLMDQKGVATSCTHGRPPVFLQDKYPVFIVSAEEAIDLSKYCGDYERDPSYMQRIQSTSPQLTLLANTPLAKSRGSTISQDDSGFCTYSSQPQCMELKRQSSLPDIPHVYQALQPKTMDPRLPYENVQKQGRQSSA